MTQEKQPHSSILDAAFLWRDQSLIQDEAVFGQDAIWTMDNLRALWVALTVDDLPDQNGFIDTLQQKLGGVGPDATRLCAELLWVLFLAPVATHIAPARKSEIIKTVHDWSGVELSASHPMLKAPLADGIANPGMHFSAHRCEELLFLIKAVVGIKKKGLAEREMLLRDAWKTGRVFDEAASTYSPQMNHMLRYLLFPLHYEPIFSRRSKRRITESFSGIPRKETQRWSVTQLDEELLRARDQLQALYDTEDLSFYREPLVSTWQSRAAGAGLSERRHWIEKCEVTNRPDRQSGVHAVGKALWRPHRTADGTDAGAIMREIEEGDVIFHFTDNKGITGASIVAGDIDENFICLQGTTWQGQPGNRIELRAYTEMSPELQPLAVLSEPKFQDDMRRLAEQHQSLFFNHRLTLNQGTYLTEAPEELVRIFDQVYFEANKLHLPHVELSEPEDVPEPQPETSEQEYKHAPNQVLYGAPGTGKTYTAMIRAVEICDGYAPSNHDDLMRRYSALQATNRIRLTTFHPSYGYADFIESTRIVRSSVVADELDIASGKVKPGVFKEMAELARASAVARDSTQEVGVDQPIWKLSLGGNVGTAYRDMVRDDFITIQQKQDAKPADDTEDAGTSIQELSKQMRIGDLVIVSDSVLTYRAIGRVVGDYLPTLHAGGGVYKHVRAVQWLTTCDDSQSWHRIARRKFSSTELYQLDPAILKLEELTLLLSESPQQEPDNYVLLIDEIGRGNTAEIFGELITLIEADKRAGASHNTNAILPLSGEMFDVPANLYLIGTLNSSDDAGSLGDSVLRRRFEFEELMPDASLIRGDDQLGTISDGKGDRIDLRALMDTINRRLDFIVGRKKMLGHAFFMHIHSFDGLVRALHHQIIPQLFDTLEGDWSRMQLIFKDLLDDGQPNHPQVIRHERQTSASVLGIDQQDIGDKIRFWVTSLDDMTPDALRKIYQAN